MVHRVHVLGSGYLRRIPRLTKIKGCSLSICLPTAAASKVAPLSSSESIAVGDTSLTSLESEDMQFRQ